MLTGGGQLRGIGPTLKKAWRSRSFWGGYLLLVLVLHTLGISGLILTARDIPAFWGLGLLAYSFGLRHAMDIDHIAAIDNTVRKLVQQQKNPLGVGFFFSLGHSTIVFLLVLLIVFAVNWVRNSMPQMQEIGGVIGTMVSGSFLVIIGLVNLVVLINLCQIFRKMRNGTCSSRRLEELLAARGLFARILKPLLRMISRSWHVYLLGFLFGLGFDTASEVGLLAISAGAVKSPISEFGILALPVLFAAGMCLLDTADGMFMTTAYRWAFSTPLRKMYYNVTVTTVSVVAALFVGVVEIFQTIGDRFHLQGLFFHWIRNFDLGHLGFELVVLFVFAWAISVAIWKFLKLENN